LRPTVILLAFNSADSLPATLASVAVLTDDIHVVDSGSTDTTVAIAESFGARVLNHPFKNYGDQRNWAIENIACRYPWQLHLDADERLTDALREEILALPDDPPSVNGFFLPRYLQFMGKLLRHNLAPTWHMRLFRNGLGRCEVRNYDQHFLCDGPTGRLNHEMIDDIRMSLSEWTFRHNRWSDAEVSEILNKQTEGRVQASLSGNIVQRKRSLRKIYDATPLFVRPFALFFYRYFLRLGFLDGKEGLIFCILQTLWFRFLIDAKIYEIEKSKRAAAVPK
jgi:glycosyltransferase involved in cell wall biosynthesis